MTLSALVWASCSSNRAPTRNHLTVIQGGGEPRWAISQHDTKLQTSLGISPGYPHRISVHIFRTYNLWVIGNVIYATKTWITITISFKHNNSKSQPANYNENANSRWFVTITDLRVTRNDHRTNYHVALYASKSAKGSFITWLPGRYRITITAGE